MVLLLFRRRDWNEIKANAGDRGYPDAEAGTARWNGGDNHDKGNGACGGSRACGVMAPASGYTCFNNTAN